MSGPTMEDLSFAMVCCAEQIAEYRRTLASMSEYASPEFRQEVAQWIAVIEGRNARFREGMMSMLASRRAS